MTWIEDELQLDSRSAYGIATLPYGVVSRGDDKPVVAVRVGAPVIDLAEVSDAVGHAHADVFAQPSLNALMTLGPRVWREVRAWVRSLVDDEAHREIVKQHLLPVDEVTAHLPVEVADYVDFYASE